uniref:Golgi to ER traffic protein 4 homolog (Trinotate prediction) n=1 Tax=Henneguya salminicola TaxID=69463 RepID=A0A6G3MFX1_HENSL
MSGYFQKTLIAIENSIAKKEFYHALQLIKSMVFRYQNTQTYEEALDFLIQNINKFMEFNEVESAVELCNMYMDIIEKNHGLNTDKIFHDLLKIVQFMTISHKLWRPFQSRISEYLKKLNNSSYTAQIEQAYAFLFLDAGNCELARFHSFNIQDSSVLCDFLLKYSQKFIQQEELDLFLLQFVLL